MKLRYDEKLDKFLKHEPYASIDYMTKEDFETVDRLIRAHFSGRLIETPVRIGQKVWWILFDEVLDAFYVTSPDVVVEIGTRGFWTDREFPEEFDPTGYCCYETYDAIDTICFLSKEDAEAALADMEVK